VDVEMRDLRWALAAVNTLVAPSRGSTRRPLRAGPSRLSASASRQKAFEAAIPPGTKRMIQSTSGDHGSGR
jgi:hypothetical protein